jgi:hypothetical protein
MARIARPRQALQTSRARGPASQTMAAWLGQRGPSQTCAVRLLTSERDCTVGRSRPQHQPTRPHLSSCLYVGRTGWGRGALTAASCRKSGRSHRTGNTPMRFGPECSSAVEVPRCASPGQARATPQTKLLLAKAFGAPLDSFWPEIWLASASETGSAVRTTSDWSTWLGSS